MPLKQNKLVMLDATIKHIATIFPISTESLKSTSTLQRPRVIIRDFSLNTSTHGIPGIARSESIHNRIFWSILFIIFTGVTFYFVIQAILAYFQYPTQTSVSFSNQWPQAFPAVTICNYSPYRYDRFIGPFLNYTNTLNLTNTNDTSTFTAQQASYISDYLQYKLSRNESLNDFYYSLDSMLIKCTYNGVNCSSTDFIKFISSMYGLCYTFNALVKHINNGVVYNNNENGYAGLLELELYTHSHQYVPFVSDGVGIVTMVHDNTQIPYVDRVGDQLIPGRKHRFGYSKRTYFFLSSPYTTCSNKATPGMQAIFDRFSGATYTYDQESCYRTALQSYTYQQCGCIDPFQWDARYIVVPGTRNIIYAKLCNISDACYSDAANQFQGSSSPTAPSAQLTADCGLECSSNEFIIKKSSISAPPQWRMDDIKQFVESSSIPLPANWSTTWSTDIQANFVGLSVECETTRVESYTQQATLTAVDVISNVGGQTGLWIGISFLSIMEVVEMLYRLIRHRCYTIREKLRNQTPHTPL